jgi:hypothetical protein
MDTSHDNGDLVRHQAMFSSFMKAATWGIIVVIVVLSGMAIFLL